jgi:hypothetical protein
MYFYSLAELLEQAIQEWCAAHGGDPLETHDVSDLAFTLADVLLNRTDLPIDPPTDEIALPPPSGP